MIYLDYAASTPMCDEALNMYNTLNKEMFGNASSLHDAGGQAAYALDLSRQRIADMTGGQKEGVYFTTGGTESNMLAVQSILNGLPQHKKHWIMSALEHHSMYNLAALLERQGYELTIVQPDKAGRITRDILLPHLRENTGLVSVQHANSETGLIQDLAALSPLLRERGILLHSDAVQTFGNIPIDVAAMGVDALSVSSHKVYGPKGVGAVYLKPGTPWRPVYPDTLHENGFRPGTVNVPGIAAFVAAAEMMTEQMELHQERYAALRQYFFTKIQERSIPLRLALRKTIRLRDSVIYWDVFFTVMRDNMLCWNVTVAVSVYPPEAPVLPDITSPRLLSRRLEHPIVKHCNLSVFPSGKQQPPGIWMYWWIF